MILEILKNCNELLLMYGFRCIIKHDYAMQVRQYQFNAYFFLI
jgi:hypothetical protein